MHDDNVESWVGVCVGLCGVLWAAVVIFVAMALWIGPTPQPRHGASIVRLCSQPDILGGAPFEVPWGEHCPPRAHQVQP